MKSSFFLVSMAILSCIQFSHSQTVKVKKDKVLFDNVPVALVNVKGRDYTYTSLGNDNHFIVAYEPASDSQGSEAKLLITDPISGHSKEAPMEWYSVSMNFKKGIAELMAKKYNIITDNGVENVASLFSDVDELDEPEAMISDEEKMEKAIKVYEEKLKNNKNIVNQYGYFIDKDGEKWKGKVTIEVEKLIDPREGDMTGQFSHKGAMSGKLDYFDEKGEPIEKHFFANRGDKVCVRNANNSESCYIGIKLKTDKLLTIDSSLSDAINSSYFYEIVYEGINSLVFKSPRDEYEIGYKRKDKKEGFLILNKNNQRNVNNLKRYFDCEFNDELLNADFTPEEHIISALKYYEKNCR